MLCAEHRRERRERKAATRRGRKDEQARAKRKRTKAGQRRAGRKTVQTGATRGRVTDSQRPKQRQQGNGRSHHPNPPQAPHEVALDGLGAAARTDEASRQLLGLPVTATQDQRFALIDSLQGRQPTLLSAYAAQPGCPPDIRFLALLEGAGELLDEHCRLYDDDDKDELLRALWDRLHAER